MLCDTPMLAETNVSTSPTKVAEQFVHGSPATPAVTASYVSGTARLVRPNARRHGPAAGTTMHRHGTTRAALDDLARALELI
jgi:hypothetical protein